MPAEFQVVNERVIVTKYSDPVRSSDVDKMVNDLAAYAEQALQPILAIADFSKVKHFPSSLITTGLRQGDVNPVRNPKIGTLLVIADSTFLTRLVSTVSRITGSKKIVMVRTREEADREIQAFIQNV